MPPARFVVGIDLGTTNTALAYADTGGDPAPKTFPVPQVVGPGDVQPRDLLPSFLYLPGPGEQPAGALKLPWDADRDYCVGEFARSFGAKVPTRLAASAKSWLCHPGADRTAPILPFRAGDGDRRVSPVDACTRYLRHLAEAWNHAHAAVPDHRLELQDVVLTVPASFDAAARDLTVQAARAAGFEQLTLLEEPQAAFYAWLDARGDRWRSEVSVGDLVLVADVGGGTTDFTLIGVGEEAGALLLTRLAVGDHLLLGGDNMDLAVAHAAAAALTATGTRLDAGQMLQLTHAARLAKEQLLGDNALPSAAVTVLGKGRSVVGGSVRHDLPRADVEAVLVDGFFPRCSADAVPARSRAAGLQELGLPYAADAGVTRHLAAFLARQREATGDRPPTAVLFNGGVFKADRLRGRFLEVVGSWAAPPRELAGADLDRACARGAAYYGLVRRGNGVRIRGGTARAYYVGVEAARPAVPGLPPPIKALCVAPFGMEEGTEADIPQLEFGLVVGEEAEFRFLGSTVRRDDAPGTVVDDWADDLDELTPVRTQLDGPAGQVVPVHLHSRVTEVGQLELECRSRDGGRRWKLSYDVR
jgi:hypothetical protein